MQGFTDIHHHLVYGVDDGAQTREQALDMAQAASRDGITTLVCTLHITPGVVPFEAEKYFLHLQDLRAACQGLNLRLLEGAEILYTDSTCRHLWEKRIPTLGGSRLVLVEFSPEATYGEISDAVEGILRAGCHPVIAHVERYRALASVARLRALRQATDALVQMNCSTVLGGKGFLRDRLSRRLLDEGLIDIVATDAHNTTTRPTRMRATYEWLREKYGPDYAAALTGLDETTELARMLRG